MKANKRNYRLYFVGGVFVLLTFILWARLIQIQVFSTSHYSDIAENQWKVTKEVPPVRGGIFDRNGRPLALSIRSCSVSLRPQDVKDRGRVASVLSRHLSLSERSIRKHLRSRKQFVWVKRQCTLSDEARVEIEGMHGVEVHWEADRVYPFGGTAAKIVGFVGHDSKGMAGVEAAFDGVLTGVPGWEQVQRDGAYRSRGYHTYAEKKPLDGKHVILTIDAGLQEIAELELERAVSSTGAKGGALIVLNSRTGEILSLAELPSAVSRNAKDLVDSLWTIRSITNIYEPGSTFKLVTAAALLETSKVRSFDVFDGENGRANMGAAVISDAHPHGHLTFREGFVFSSNIVMAKASLNLKPREFFKFVRLFGFGAKTGVHLLGESPGSVAPVDKWSKRTQITMAFGQEIAVTPLQMANAFAAVANDGILTVPRIIKSVVDENTGDIETYDRVKIRRVVAKDTARRMRNFCRSVVEEGTGTKAALSYLELSGKTGTAEKASASGGYSANKFIASFVGFAPYEDPQIVCLVMLDEPSYYNRFGGVSAAPVFAKMMAAIANSSTMFDHVLTTDVLESDRAEINNVFVAPNFLRLDRARAMDRARRLELNVLCKGDGGEVVAQDPDPGVAMGRDEVVRLYLSGAPPSAPHTTPDLRGLPMRVAKRKAVLAGLRCTVVGTGLVASQKPAPGTVSASGTVKIYCRNAATAQRKS
jgi:cell division protein FtsI/penicillin-binding protein 2